MSINLWALIVVIITTLLYSIIKGLSSIGDLRALAIGRWVSSYIALPELLKLFKISAEKSVMIIYGFGIIVIFAILMIWKSSDNPQVYMGIFRKVYYYVPRIGAILWLIFSALLQVLKQLSKSCLKFFIWRFLLS